MTINKLFLFICSTIIMVLFFFSSWFGWSWSKKKSQEVQFRYVSVKERAILILKLKLKLLLFNYKWMMIFCNVTLYINYPYLYFYEAQLSSIVFSFPNLYDLGMLHELSNFCDSVKSFKKWQKRCWLNQIVVVSLLNFVHAFFLLSFVQMPPNFQQ